jgi:hypothetical protein
LQAGPQKEVLLCNVVLGAGSGGPAAIPAGDRQIPAGGGWGSGLWATRVRFGGSVGGEELPVGGAPDGRRRWLPRLPVPASLRPGKATGGGGRFREGLWR